MPTKGQALWYVGIMMNETDVVLAFVELTA